MKSFSYYASVLCICLFTSCDETSETQPSEEMAAQKVIMNTTHGSMEIKLYDETPLHRDNFINLARNHAYDSVLFHRVIENFMIQGGDPDSKRATPTDTLGDGGAPYRVQAEFHPKLFHKKGVLAAARDGNPERASSSMQFYIVQGKVFNDSTLNVTEERIHKTFAVDYFKEKQFQTELLDSLDAAMDNRNLQRYNQLKDSIYQMAITDANFKPYVYPEAHRAVYKSVGGTPHLDQTYTVFGEVIKGMEVIDSIAAVETGARNRPIEDVRILSVQVIEE